MRILARELRFAVRLLLRTPGFAAVGIVALGLAIGACTAIYSVVDAVALRPLPYPGSERIARLTQLDEAGQPNPFSDAQLRGCASPATSFEAMAEFGAGTTSVVADTQPLRAGVSAVSREFFDVLATSPSRGRRFGPDELHDGGPRAAIVSARFWNQHFSSLSNLSDARLRVNGDLYTIVGLMPAGFEFPAGIEILGRRAKRDHAIRSGRARTGLSSLASVRESR